MTQSLFFRIRGMLGVVLTALCILACTPLAPQGGAANSTTGIVISVEGTSGSKSILTPEYSSGVANAFEAILIGNDSLQSATLGTNGSATIALNPGEYTVIVLAGYRRSETASTILLLGSATAEAVHILNGQQTAVNLILHPVDFNFELSGPATAGGTVAIHASGVSRNAHVGMSLSGTSTTLRPRLRSTLLWNGYHEFQTVAGSETQWSADLTVSVPNINGALDAQFQGAQVSLVDCGTNSGSLTGKTAGNWKWLNRADMIDGGPLVNLVQINTSITPPSTGISMILAWE